MTEQMKRNDVEERLTENQRAVQAKLKKVIKKVGGIPREVAEATIDNFLTVFREDENFADLRFNVLSNRPERVSADGRREWTASDDAWSRGYIEKVYEIHSQSKWQDAFIQMQGERTYNPAQDIVSSIQWDGKSRCERFLIEWMGAEDTPYNREVSRLIFAGGINRLFNPGCKFDCVLVLIGAQGGGKSRNSKSSMRYGRIHWDYSELSILVSSTSGDRRKNFGSLLIMRLKPMKYCIKNHFVDLCKFRL